MKLSVFSAIVTAVITAGLGAAPVHAEAPICTEYSRILNADLTVMYKSEQCVTEDPVSQTYRFYRKVVGDPAAKLEPITAPDGVQKIIAANAHTLYFARDAADMGDHSILSVDLKTHTTGRVALPGGEYSHEETYSGDTGFYFLVYVKGERRFVHVGDDGKVTVLPVATEKQMYRFGLDYYAPALKITYEPATWRLITIERATGGKMFGKVALTNLNLGDYKIADMSWLQFGASRDGRVVLISGPLTLEGQKANRGAAFLDEARGARAFYALQDITGTDTVRISPSGKYFLYQSGDVLEVRAVDGFSLIYKRTRAQGPLSVYYGCFFAAENRIVISDGQGHYEVVNFEVPVSK